MRNTISNSSTLWFLKGGNMCRSNSPIISNKIGGIMNIWHRTFNIDITISNINKIL